MLPILPSFVKREEISIFQLSPLYLEIHKRNLLKSPVLFASNLFSEEQVTDMLNAAQSLASLKYQQALINVARNVSRSASRSFVQSPGRNVSGFSISSLP